MRLPERLTDDLLLATEPPPYTIIPERSELPLLLTCDHSSNRIPAALGDLGLDEQQRQRHIAWDPGAREVTELVAELLGAGAVLCEYSRLVVDCNRRLDDPTAFVEQPDGIPIPANQGMDDAERERRAQAIHRPYHDAIDRELRRRVAGGQHPALFSIHSFTPVLAGERRPWQVGVLWDKDDRLPVPLMAQLAEIPGVQVGDNQPYSGRAHWDYTIDHHAEAAGLPHAVIELRQDLVRSPEGQREWAGHLARILRRILEDLRRTGEDQL